MWWLEVLVFVELKTKTFRSYLYYTNEGSLLSSRNLKLPIERNKIKCNNWNKHQSSYTLTLFA